MSPDARFLKSCNIEPCEIPALPPRRAEPPPAATPDVEQFPFTVDADGIAHIAFAGLERLQAVNRALHQRLEAAQHDAARVEADRATRRGDGGSLPYGIGAMESCFLVSCSRSSRSQSCGVIPMKEQEIQGHSLSPASGSTVAPGVSGVEICRACHGEGRALSIQGIPDAKCPVCRGSGVRDPFYGVWRCSNCSAMNSESDPAWRWDGQAWEHKCGDPQAGHHPARYFGYPGERFGSAPESKPGLSPSEEAGVNGGSNAATPVQLQALRDLRWLVQGISFNAENNSESSDFVSRTRESADAAVKLLDQMIGDQPERIADGLTPASDLAGAAGVTGSEATRPALPAGHSILSISAGGAPLVTIKSDGEIVYGDNYQPDEAARIFWAAMRQHFPAGLAAAPQYVRDIAAYLADHQDESVAVLVVDGAHRLVKIAATNWEDMDATAARIAPACHDARAFHEAGKARGDFAESKPNITLAPETHDTSSSDETVKG